MEENQPNRIKYILLINGWGKRLSRSYFEKPSDRPQKPIAGLIQTVRSMAVRYVRLNSGPSDSYQVFLLTHISCSD
jgi:hypothetical protein